MEVAEGELFARLQWAARDVVGRRRPRNPGGLHTSTGGDNEISWRERSSPSFFIRLRSVFGCMSRICAAPRGPSMTQPVCASVASDVGALDRLRVCLPTGAVRSDAGRGPRRRVTSAAAGGCASCGAPAGSHAPMSSTPPRRQHERALDDVLQLADVARPCDSRRGGPCCRARRPPRSGRCAWRDAGRRTSRAAGYPCRRSRSGGTRSGSTFRR